ncbi:MAG: T9SS type A sorting domain-containing protein, partial [Cyclobacteriaceae bacterium]|nr:T9SS type A sorting domain-containing protein [Cyclobacteriaceae bacterium]
TYSQTCTADANITGTNTITASTSGIWTATGGATCPPTSTFVGDVIIDIGGNDTFVWDYDLTMTGNFDVTLANSGTIQFDNNLFVTGNFPIVNSGNSDLIISTGSTVSVIAGVNGDMGDPNNNNVTFTVDGTLNVDGTLSSKNGTVFGGTGTIDAAVLDLGSTTCDGGGCPVITSPTCTGDVTFCTDNVTPVVLLYFDAKIKNDQIVINWSTASEENNDFFTIERSEDGENFHDLALISGAGTSFEKSEYSYIDNNPFEGVSYYRLKQTDFDGTNETFYVVAVEYYGDSDAIRIIQYADNVNSLKIYSNLDEENVANIYDSMGRISKSFTLHQGENTIDLTGVSNLTGIYFIRVVNALGKELISERILINN